LIANLFAIGWQQLRFSRSMRNQASISDPGLLQLAEEGRSLIGVATPVRMIATSHVSVPALFGVRRPCLLLPKELLARVSMPELRLIILHELAHVKRRDTLLNWLMIVARAWHWFNPLVWLVLRRLRADRELVCDQMVLRSLAPAERKLYGHTLLKLLDDFSGPQLAPGLVPILKHKQETKRRIVMISQFKPSGALASVSTAALVIILCCLTFTRAADPTRSASTRAVAEATADPQPVKRTVATTDDERELRMEDVEGIAPLLRSPAKAKPDMAKAIARLEAQLKVHDERVRAAQAEVDSLRRELGGVIPQDEKQIDPETVRLIEKERIAMDAQAAKFRALREELLGKSREEMLQMLPTVMPDTLLASMLERLSTYETELARFSSEFGPGHPDVQSRKAAMSNLNKQVDTRIQGILSGLSAQVSANAASSAALRKLIEDARQHDAILNEKSVPYFQAKRNLETQQRIRETIMLRILQEKVDAALLKE
jgi:hypothetical protein